MLPAETTKSFWLDNKTVSADYLEQMSIFALQLALNNSPETFDYNVKKLLSYVAPEDRGETELQLVSQGRRLKASNASVHFMPESVEVRPAKLQAAVTGSIRQFIGNSKTSSSESAGRFSSRTSDPASGSTPSVSPTAENPLSRFLKTGRERTHEASRSRLNALRGSALR